MALTARACAAAAFNSNNASAEAAPRGARGAALPFAGGGGDEGGGAPLSSVTRTYLRRSGAFPPTGRGMPRNPKWALRVPAAAAALAARGPHALALQIHNVWDRANCSRCLRPPALRQAGTTPEVDACAGFYAREEAKAAPAGRCTRNWCTGPSGAVAEGALKVHHYVLPRGAKSYRRHGRGDAGARRDAWEGDVRDGDALRFAP